MKQRILVLATVAALVAMMLVAMAPAALAIGPPNRVMGCDGGTNTANHAAQQSSPSGDVTSGGPSVAENPTENSDEHRNSEPAGEDTASDNLQGDNCRH
jgi:hypothetical protein